MSGTFNAPKDMTEMEAHEKGAKWVIELTYNNGDVGTIATWQDNMMMTPKSYAECAAIVEELLDDNSTFHMIIIKKDGKDLQRWDRERVLGGVDWHEVEDLDEIKTLGPINQFNLIEIKQ